jgi:hypothetical protein
MPVAALSSTQTQRLVGDQWPITVRVTDLDGYTTGETPVVTITKPDGTTTVPTMTAINGGSCRAAYTLATPGRHIATVSTTLYGATAFAVTAVAPTAAGAMPTVADVNSYLGEHSWEDGDLANALGVESAAQRSACAIPAFYPDDLRGALMRRVQRNLSLRSQPTSSPPEGDVPNVQSTYDPEVRRLEKPHWKLLVA